MKLDPSREPGVTEPMRRLSPTQIAVILAGIFILAFAIWTFVGTRRFNPVWDFGAAGYVFYADL